MALCKQRIPIVVGSSIIIVGRLSGGCALPAKTGVFPLISRLQTCVRAPAVLSFHHAMEKIEHKTAVITSAAMMPSSPAQPVVERLHLLCSITLLFLRVKYHQTETSISRSLERS